MNAAPRTPCAPGGWPGVSVVMPVLNEERHLEAAVSPRARPGLSRAARGDLGGRAEPGPDAARSPPSWLPRTTRVRVLDNPAGRTPHALNLAIAAARHDIIVRVDGHGELADGYIARAVELLAETGAANVGGVMDAQGETPFEEAVAYAYTTRLGLGGPPSTWGRRRQARRRPCSSASSARRSCWRSAASTRRMHRAQDWELNYRLRQAGLSSGSPRSCGSPTGRGRRLGADRGRCTTPASGAARSSGGTGHGQRALSGAAGGSGRHRRRAPAAVACAASCGRAALG